MKTLFDGLIGINMSMEKRLLVDLALLRQFYEQGEIAEVEWFSTEANPAVVMTKTVSKKTVFSLKEENIYLPNYETE